MLKIITGYTGVDHVTSSDDASLYRSILGSEDYVLNVGKKLEATVISNNLIRVSDGDLVIQGHQARIRTNDYEELVIDNGTPGQQRHDLIVARYEKDVVSGIESIKLAVVKGTPAVTGVDPELTQDDITSGGTLREFPLYRVKLNGINIESVDKLFNTIHLDLSNFQYENGNNANGTYRRYADGRLVCEMEKVIDLNSGAWQIVTFPAAFIKEPDLTFNAKYTLDGNVRLALVNTRVFQDTNTAARVIVTANQTSGTYKVLIKATGPWK